MPPADSDINNDNVIISSSSKKKKNINLRQSHKIVSHQSRNLSQVVFDKQTLRSSQQKEKAIIALSKKIVKFNNKSF